MLRFPKRLAVPTVLRAAWKRVRANGGCAGGDGQSLNQFAAQLKRRINNLSGALAAGRYHPGPVRVVSKRKPDGASRTLAIPCVRDRIVQTAALQLLSPALDRRMNGRSFAYRPARGVRHALADARRLRASGLCWIAETDVADCFNQIRHDRLLDELAIWLSDARWLNLFELWLRAGGRKRGAPQGAPISPLLCNLFLHPVDQALAARSIAHIRYADDLILLTRARSDALDALAVVKLLLSRRSLRIQDAKASIITPDDSCRFLGEQIAPAG